MWLRLILEYIARALPVAAPLLIPKDYPPVSWVIKALEHFKIPKPADSQLQAIVALCGLVLVFGFDVYNLYIPKQDSRRFGKAFFDRMVKDFTDQGAPKFGRDLRMNVLLLRWPKRLGRFNILPLRWVANVGFDPAFGVNADAHFWIWGFQGVCGRALRKGFPQFSDLRTEKPRDATWSLFFPSRENFRLFRWQIRRTGHLKAILSVPINRPDDSPTNPRLRIVGVVNLDAVSDDGADWLKKEREQTTKYLSDHGQFLTYLS
jgi:hypothetical protein